MAYTPATLTGHYQTPGGQPAKGTVEIIPNSKQIIDAAGDVILAGRAKVTLDETGAFSVTLPPTDDASLEPATGRQYTIVAKLHSSHLPAVTGVELASGETVDVADVSARPTTDALVSPAATTAQLDALEASLTTSLAGKQDAGDYATTTDLADKADVTALDAKQDTATLDASVAAEIQQVGSSTNTALSATLVPRRQMPGPREFLRYTAATTSESYDLIGIDTVDGRMFFTGAGGIMQSSDDGATLSANKTLPTGVTNFTWIKKVQRFGAHLYLLARDDATGFGGVWRALPQAGNTAFAWTKVLSHRTGCNRTIGTCLQADDTYIYCGEYGDPTGGPVVYRSADGVTWDAIYGPLAGIRHIHAVNPDPYNPGHLWMTIGDGVPDPIRYSTNYGTTWASISADSGWQGVQVSFTEDHIFLAGDSARGTVIVVDRATKTPRFGSLDNHAMIAVPGAAPRPGGNYFSDGGFTSGSVVINSATAAFTAADVGRFVDRQTTGDFQVPLDAFIAEYVSATQVKLNKTATGTSAATKFVIRGDEFYRSAFYGIVDPATGYYYAIANDDSSGGKVSGLFVLTAPGERLVLLDRFASQVTGEAFIRNGYLWTQGRKHRLLL